MINLGEVLYGFVLPAVLALAGVLASVALRRGGSPWRTRPAWDGVAVAIAVAMAFAASVGWHAPPFADVKHWLPGWALLAALAMAVAGPAQGHAAWRWLVRTAFIALVLASMMRATPACHEWSVAGTAAWSAAFGLGWLAMLWAWEGAAAAAPGSAVVAAGVGVGLGAVALALFGSVMLAKLEAGLLAPLAAAAAVLWWRGAPGPARALVAVACLLLPPLLLFGYFFADLPLWGLPLITAAGATGWLGALRPLSEWRPWKRLLAVGIAAALVACAVLIVGVVSSIQASSSGGPSY